jgi:DNA/RNA endonuclease YhcR with UshA esterase domain
MKTRLLIALVVCGYLFAGFTVGQGNKKIRASEAGQHIHERATVCGNVASSRYLSKSRSQPTFLNLGKSYPNQDFTVVIWPEDRPQFGHPEDTYLGKNICVSGEISSYRGTPQIVARYPSQIHEE